MQYAEGRMQTKRRELKEKSRNKIPRRKRCSDSVNVCALGASPPASCVQSGGFRSLESRSSAESPALWIPPWCGILGGGTRAGLALTADNHEQGVMNFDFYPRRNLAEIGLLPDSARFLCVCHEILQRVPQSHISNPTLIYLDFHH